MAAKALMIMGTGSDVGKSLVVAGLCRAFADRGLRVAPFKPQNMSNNAAVTADGGEIGRAQALQARAARTPALTAMNPVLLKPEAETGAQVVVRGQRIASMPAREYWAKRGALMPQILEAFSELAAQNDIILVEGAGSASEVNLRQGDIANFGFARAANLPVVIVGDIGRGGVIAALVGTFAVIAPEDAALVVATLINRFRGDPSLFSEGLALIARHTGRPCLGPITHYPPAMHLPAEDILALDATRPNRHAGFHIVVPRLPRIANFDDLDPLAAEPGVRLTIVEPGRALPRDADLIVLPGSKATRADLTALQKEGWDIDILAHHRAGGRIIGLCGGYQMLGRSIADPEGIEGPAGESAGLGLLAVDTVLTPVKQLRVETAQHLPTGTTIAGYHMHMGATDGPDCARPFARVGEASEGAISADGRVSGTYLHGIFASDPFRRALLGGVSSPDLAYEALVEETLTGLGRHIAAEVDLDQLLALARPIGQD
ncbi:MAG: cobyric acid synthase [Devosia sp.]